MIYFLLVFLILFAAVVALPGVLSNISAEKLYEIAEEDFHRGKYPEAEKALKDITQRLPEHTRARWLLHKIYREMGRVEDATVQLKSIIKYGKYFSDISEYIVRRALAEILEGIGDKIGAMEQYEMIIKQFPEDREVLERRGEIALTQDDSVRALESYEKLAELDPDNFDYQLKLGEILYQTGRLQEALEAMDRAYVMNNRMDVALALCSILTELGRVQDAIRIYEELINQSPERTPNIVRYRLGMAYFNNKNYTQSLNQFHSINGKLTREEVGDGMDKDVLYMLAENYLVMGQPSDAKNYLKKLYNIDREYRDVAAKLKSLGDFASDEEILQRFYKLHIYEFESISKELVEKLGYTIKSSSIVDDSAINIIAEDNDDKIFCFIRRWKNEIGPLPLKDLHLMMSDNNCARGIFLASSTFNPSAKDYLRIVRNIDVYDAEQLVRTLREIGFV